MEYMYYTKCTTINTTRFEKILVKTNGINLSLSLSLALSLRYKKYYTYNTKLKISCLKFLIKELDH